MIDQPSAAAISRPEDVLPDGQERTEIGGLSLRKGTVAAFLRNAAAWTDPATPAAHRDALATAMTEALPALRAIGLFEILQIRDERLRRLLGDS